MKIDMHLPQVLFEVQQGVPKCSESHGCEHEPQPPPPELLDPPPQFPLLQVCPLGQLMQVPPPLPQLLADVPP
jgi:hypothetical protein